MKIEAWKKKIKMHMVMNLTSAVELLFIDVFHASDCGSLQRALDRRLYLLVDGNAHGAPSGKPVWHFHEKVYEYEDTMRKCAESALESIIGENR
ncbi:uncharacterized protein HKW66_Vig0030460 [Vigna angularis]|uniref:Uncharacterized protein n=2 Tax=Phaseolus angularis TaxID=3914 RepID=A0A8T0L8E8_PHAAN|nr:uncharacterized protein HKW66_Vig0030460 [Vigna angularis]BAT76001.1 hypothetical protein VIGAN_01395300 [Vigna angularis var. angularis]